MLVIPGPADAQSDLTIELGASQIGPALDVNGESARFGIAGVRASHHTSGGSGIFASVLFGRALESRSEGTFLSGLLEGRLADHWGSKVEGRLEARLLGHGMEDPFPYRAFAAEGGPVLRYRESNLSVELAGVGGIGRSELTLWRLEDGPTRLFENELWRGGATLEVLFGPVTSQFGLVGGWHDTPSGSYESVGARAVFAGRWGITELRADRWITPFSTDVVAGLSVMIPIGSAWNVRGFFGRSDPDPLTLARPGTASGGVLVGVNLLPSSDPALDRSVYEVVRFEAGRSRVRFTLEAPVESRRVELLGDFNLWEPVTMEKKDGVWQVELEVPAGTHHFGFLVDDEWYLPDDAPDVVPDEWGRLSATLVIEGAS